MNYVFDLYYILDISLIYKFKIFIIVYNGDQTNYISLLYYIISHKAPHVWSKFFC